MDHVLIARRCAVALATQAALGNDDEVNLLLRWYLRDCELAGLPHGPAFALLANQAIALVVLGVGSDVEWLRRTAMDLAVRP